MLRNGREIRHGMLLLGPDDPIKDHSAPEHLRFQIGCVLYPVKSFADPEPCLLTELIQFVVYSQRPLGGVMHHHKAIVRECLIIHGTPNPESCPALWAQDLYPTN